VQNALRKRLAKFGLKLEPNKTKLVEFGRFADRHASKRGRKRPETLYFLGFTIYCTRNRKGNYQVRFRALQRIHRNVERYWRKMLNSRNREGRVTWEVFHKIKTHYPLQRPKLALPYPKLQAIAVL